MSSDTFDDYFYDDTDAYDFFEDIAEENNMHPQVSPTDSDIDEDFFGEKEFAGFSQDEIADQKDILFSHGTPKKDPTLPDQQGQNVSRQNYNNIDALMAEFKRQENDDDTEEAFRKQRFINNQTLANFEDIPDDIYLIDEPVDFVPESAPEGSGDESIWRNLKVTSSVMVALMIGIVGTLIYTNLTAKPDQIAAPIETTVGSGNPIDQALESGGSGVSSNDPTDGDKKSSGEDGEDKGTQGSVRYQIISEGGISSASISYINGSGSSESVTGVSLPWSKTLTKADAITPHIAANPGERGTLTCKIYKDGEIIAEDTASGEHASVECKANGK